MEKVGVRSCRQRRGKKAYRWIKETPCWKNPPVEIGEEEPRFGEDGCAETGSKQQAVVCNQQGAADKEAGTWHKMWRRDSGKPPLIWPKVGREEARVLLPTDDEARTTAKKFSPGTALGADFIHPRHLATIMTPSLRWWPGGA